MFAVENESKIMWVERQSEAVAGVAEVVSSFGEGFWTSDNHTRFIIV